MGLCCECIQALNYPLCAHVRSVQMLLCEVLCLLTREPEAGRRFVPERALAASLLRYLRSVVTPTHVSTRAT
jgi:hypothetical protein